MPKSTIYSQNLTALQKTANILSGDQNEFIGYPAHVRITAVSSAVGVNLSVFADADLIIDDKPISAIGVTLDDQSHKIDEFDVEPNTRLSIFARETANVSTSDIYVGVEVTPN